MRCRWNGCFIRFLDGLLQATAYTHLAGADRALRVPVHIRSLVIKQPGTKRSIGSLGKLYSELNMRRMMLGKSSSIPWDR